MAEGLIEAFVVAPDVASELRAPAVIGAGRDFRIAQG